MAKENYKLLIRNLRIGKNAKLKIQTTATDLKPNKVGKSIRLSEGRNDNNRR